MTFIEFAENVLEIELLDWQKVVLEAAQKCKDDGKSFHINTYAHQGKTLLNNCIQQKLGYDRGFEDGAMEFANWLLHHSMLCDSLGQDLNDNDLMSESEIIDKVLAEWEKGVKENE